MVLNPLQKSKYFSREADIVLLCLSHELGYGNWNAIKHAIRRDTRVRFDHFFMSRTEMELSKRVDILVKSIEKELEQASTAKPSNNQDLEDIEMQSVSDEEPLNDSDQEEGEDSNDAPPSDDQMLGEKRSYAEMDEDLGIDAFEGLEEVAAKGLKRSNYH